MSRSCCTTVRPSLGVVSLFFLVVNAWTWRAKCLVVSYHCSGFVHLHGASVCVSGRTSSCNSDRCIIHSRPEGQTPHLLRCLLAIVHSPSLVLRWNRYARAFTPAPLKTLTVLSKRYVRILTRCTRYWCPCSVYSEPAGRLWALCSSRCCSIALGCA